MTEKTLNFKKGSCRDAFGQALVKVGEKDNRVVVLTADLGESTRTLAFKERFPSRFFEVGVAEQCLVTVASGLATAGKIPFVTSFAVFSPGRNWEQIRTTICLNDVPVKIIGSHAGINVGPDGATHQALEDIALMRSLPNMIVLAPADAPETQKAVSQAAQNPHPTYIRLPRYESPIFTADTSFEIGKANLLWQTKDPQVTIIATGPLVHESLAAAQKLKKSKISSLVINNHTIKPLDESTLIRAAKTTGCIVTVEDHQIIGGLGSAIAELLAKNFPVPIEMIGIQDHFGESGKPKELLRKYQLTSTHIASAAKRAIKRSKT